MNNREYAQKYHEMDWKLLRAGAGENGKDPIDGSRWSSPEHIHLPDHFRDGESVAIKLGAPSGIVDIDCDWELAREIASIFFGKFPSFGRNSTPRSHYIVRCDDAESLEEFSVPGIADPITGKSTIIELRGTGQYTLFPGSIHKKAKEDITWTNDEVPTLEDIPVLSWQRLHHNCAVVAALALITHHYREAGEGTRHDGCNALLGWLLRLKAPPEAARRAVQLIARLAGDEEASKRAANPDRQANKLENGARVTGLPTVFKYFGVPKAHQDLIRDWLRPFKQKVDPKAVEGYNAKHAVIRDGDAIRILLESNNDRLKYGLLTQNDFKLLYAADKANLDAWLQSPTRRTIVEGFIFDPTTTEHPHGSYNLWNGWAIDPAPGPCEVVHRHIDHLVDGVTEHAEYVRKWIAWMFQNPERPAEKALVFKGKKGSGKGSLGRFLGKLCGPHHIHASSEKSITGDFNKQLEGTIYLFADEAIWAGNRGTEGALKRLVTEDTIYIEPKHRDGYMAPNMLHIMFAANTDWVVPASIDERRWVVFDVPDKLIGDRAYFRALNKAFDDEATAFLDWALNLDLGDWHPRDDNIQTDALQVQKEISETPWEACLRDCLVRGSLPGTSARYNNIQNELIVDNFMRELADQGSGGIRLTKNRVGRYLRSFRWPFDEEGWRAIGFDHNNDPIRKRGRRYLLPPLGEARKQFDPHVEWPRTPAEWDFDHETTSDHFTPGPDPESVRAYEEHLAQQSNHSKIVVGRALQ